MKNVQARSESESGLGPVAVCVSDGIIHRDECGGRMASGEGSPGQDRTMLPVPPSCPAAHYIRPGRERHRRSVSHSLTHTHFMSLRPNVCLGKGLQA